MTTQDTATLADSQARMIEYLRLTEEIKQMRMDTPNARDYANMPLATVARNAHYRKTEALLVQRDEIVAAEKTSR